MFAVPLLGCSGVDVDGANGVDEAIGEQSQSFDASCTLTIDSVQTYYEASSGGDIYTHAHCNCLDGSSLEYRVTAKNPKNKSLTLSDSEP